MKKLLYILTTIFALAAGNNAANANRWGFSAVQAGAAGQWGAKYLGGLIINGAHITSPVLQGAVAGITGGAVGGYVAGFSGGFMMTGDLSAANKAGLNGALVGASVGGVSGSVSAYRYAVDNNINPWTGKSFPWIGKVLNTNQQNNDFFEGARYSEKVLGQMQEDSFHGFPESVDGYANKFGQWNTKIGADGKVYQWLEMPGNYGGKTGIFEYIKNPATGEINHRFFRVIP